MIKITDDNYEQYKKTNEMIWCAIAKVLNWDPYAEHSPIMVLARMEKESKSLAKRGLKEGLRDMITMIIMMSYSSNDIKNEINNKLLSQGLPSLNKLILAIKNTPAKVLKRGRINNLDEYYIIKEVICDLSYDIPDADRKQLGKIHFEFEFNQGNKKKVR